jgi:hypothetical protein
MTSTATLDGIPVQEPTAAGFDAAGDPVDDFAGGGSSWPTPDGGTGETVHGQQVGRATQPSAADDVPAADAVEDDGADRGDGRVDPIIQVPKLDADTTNPIYFPDLATFYPVCLKGDYLRETGPIMSKDQHNAWKNFVDLTYNFICIDRRRNMRAYQA